jgi:hypothetical protein
MGHEDISFRGTGKTKREAFTNAMDGFRDRWGEGKTYDHTISSTFIRTITVESQVFEVWEFEIDFHC